MGQIHEAIAALMSDVDAIKKDKKNSQQGFSFRGIDDVYNTLHAKLAARGVFSVPNVESERTEERQTRNGGTLIYRVLIIRYTFYASDGSSIDCRVVGEGMDSGDKAANKAMAVAHKYALLQTLCVPTDDMPDPDAETHYVKPKEEPTKPLVNKKQEAIDYSHMPASTIGSDFIGGALSQELQWMDENLPDSVAEYEKRGKGIKAGTSDKGARLEQYRHLIAEMRQARLAHEAKTEGDAYKDKEPKGIY